MSRKIDSALSRVASKRGLTKIEMETFMSAVGNASVLYDVLSSNCSLYIIRRAMKRQIAIISRAFGIRWCDRKAVLFAPVRLGGNAQRYLMCEIVCNLVRELMYFLNSLITSGLLAQTRYFAAKLKDADKDTNFIREAIHKLAECGMHVRDRDEELLSRVLDFLASSRSKRNDAFSDKPDFVNWSQVENPPPEVVKYLIRFSFDSETACRLREVQDNFWESCDEEMRSVDELAKAFINDIDTNKDIWSNILDKDELEVLPKAVNWAVNAMKQDWKNCWEVVVRKFSKEGFTDISICPRMPSDGIMHYATEEGLKNLRAAVQQRYKLMPKDPWSGVSLLEGKERYTDGSYDQDKGNCGWALVCGKSSIQLSQETDSNEDWLNSGFQPQKFEPDIALLKRLPRHSGTQPCTINCGVSELQGSVQSAINSNGQI